MPAGVRTVLLVEPRGFCAGVDAAIKTLAWMVALYDEPVYCVHEIVHNDEVVARFAALGVIFVEHADDVPAGNPVVLSAHGSSPATEERARAHGAVVVDAVCPLVTKVHHEIRTRAAAGATILYVGHRGHDEAEAAIAIAAEAARLVEPGSTLPQDVPAAGPVALLAQTTLALDDLEAVEAVVRDRFPAVWTPRRADLCYATTNRQRALAAACERADAVVVVGSRTSANTRALVELGRRHGRRTVRVDDADELPDDLTGTVAVTAGASAPERAVTAVVQRLAPVAGVERYAPVAEAAYFPPPPELRRLLGEVADTLPAPLRDALDHDRTVGPVELLARVEMLRAAGQLRALRSRVSKSSSSDASPSRIVYRRASNAAVTHGFENRG